MKKSVAILVSFVVFFLWMQFVQMFTTYNESTVDITVRAIIYYCLFAPLWEEAVYRYAPIKLAKEWIGEKAVFPVMILASYMFAEGHGQYMENILCQGVLGMLCSFLCYKYGYLASVTLHGLWNLSVLLNIST